MLKGVFFVFTSVTHRMTYQKDLFPDLKYNYNSMKNDFKNDAISKVTFYLKHPSLGIALGEGAVAYTIGHTSRAIQTLVFPADIPQEVS